MISSPNFLLQELEILWCSFSAVVHFFECLQSITFTIVNLLGNMCNGHTFGPWNSGARISLVFIFLMYMIIAGRFLKYLASHESPEASFSVWGCSVFSLTLGLCGSSHSIHTKLCIGYYRMSCMHRCSDTSCCKRRMFIKSSGGKATSGIIPRFFLQSWEITLPRSGPSLHPSPMLA